MTSRDYYQILGVSSSASQEEIKNAYRRLAKIYHPDIRRTISATFRMQMINKAYSILGNPIKRAEYDRVRQAQRESPHFRQQPYYQHNYKEQKSGGNEKSERQRPEYSQRPNQKEAPYRHNEEKTNKVRNEGKNESSANDPEIEKNLREEHEKDLEKWRGRLVFLFSVSAAILFIWAAFTGHTGYFIIAIGLLVAFVNILNYLLSLGVKD